MPAVHRKGDSGSGHGCFPPRNSVGGSSNVFINNIPLHRVGDGWSVHCLHGSEEVLILNLGYVKIEDLVLNGVEQGTYTLTKVNSSDGYKLIDSEITGVYIKGEQKEFIKLHTKSGSTLVTPDHLVLIGSKYIEAKDVKENGEIIHIEHIRYSKPQSVYDIRVDNKFNSHNFKVKSGLYLHNCCGSVCHGGSQASGSPNVFANNKAFARVGDSVDCGSTAVGSSPNVFAN